MSCDSIINNPAIIKELESFFGDANGINSIISSDNNIDVLITSNEADLTLASTISTNNVDLLVGGDYQINGVSVLNASTLGASVLASSLTSLGNLASLSLAGDISSSVAVDFDLLDNNASALSFDAAGKAGILEIVTTDTTEGVKMSGTLEVTGSSTFTGRCSTGPTAGYLYSGTLTDSGAGTTAILDSKVGSCEFTGVDINAASSQAFTITNASAGSAGLISFSCNSVASVSLHVLSAVWTQGVGIVVTLRNTAAATATGASTFRIDFVSFN